MFFEYDGSKMYYETEGNMGTTVLFLHGWGGSTQSFKGAYEVLAAKNRRCLILDFLGFGKSDLPNGVYGLEQYVQSIKALILHLKLDKISIVAHSFGGRVALLFASQNPHLVEKLVLCGCAGLRPRRRLSYYIRVLKYKSAKKKGKDLSSFGSADYKALPDNMKATFIKIVNSDLKKCLSDIRCDTLIIWGKKDSETPPYMARRLKKGIYGSGLIFFEDAGHYVHIEKFNSFCRIINVFLS